MIVQTSFFHCSFVLHVIVTSFCFIYLFIFLVLQVKAFSKSLESFKTAIVVGGTNIAEQVTDVAS